LIKLSHSSDSIVKTNKKEARVQRKHNKEIIRGSKKRRKRIRKNERRKKPKK